MTSPYHTSYSGLVYIITYICQKINRINISSIKDSMLIINYISVVWFIICLSALMRNSQNMSKNNKCSKIFFCIIISVIILLLFEQHTTNIYNCYQNDCLNLDIDNNSYQLFGIIIQSIIIIQLLAHIIFSFYKCDILYDTLYQYNYMEEQPLLSDRIRKIVSVIPIISFIICFILSVLVEFESNISVIRCYVLLVVNIIVQIRASYTNYQPIFYFLFIQILATTTTIISIIFTITVITTNSVHISIIVNFVLNIVLCATYCLIVCIKKCKSRDIRGLAIN
jgi:hypothetical protein